MADHSLLEGFVCFLIEIGLSAEHHRGLLLEEWQEAVLMHGLMVWLLHVLGVAKQVVDITVQTQLLGISEASSLKVTDHLVHLLACLRCRVL